jgi:hypothetical protein
MEIDTEQAEQPAPIEQPEVEAAQVDPEQVDTLSAE